MHQPSGRGHDAWSDAVSKPHDVHLAETQRAPVSKMRGAGRHAHPDKELGAAPAGMGRRAAARAWGSGQRHAHVRHVRKRLGGLLAGVVRARDLGARLARHGEEGEAQQRLPHGGRAENWGLRQWYRTPGEP